MKNGTKNHDSDSKEALLFARQALALSTQQWSDLGRGDDPFTGTPNSIEEAAMRITHVLLIRLIAIRHRDKFSNLATSTVAKAVLEANDPSLTDEITSSLTLQLETYVTCILYGYFNDLPFHNYQHAYHVTMASNKLVEAFEPRNSYGLASDPLSLFALIFCAIIHDTGHTGVSNLQRAKDDKDLAETYGDTSIHEHHSLHKAFSELKKDEYAELRNVMFVDNSDFDTFQNLVYQAVLSTDIASPMRAEAAKIKYFEAFPIELADDYEYEDESGANRRSSIASNISVPRVHTNKSRRSSVGSVNSDITMDSYNMIKHQNKLSRNTAAAMQSRRASNGSNSKYGYGPGAPVRRGVARRHSIETVDSHYSEFAADSIRMTQERPAERRASASGVPQRRLSASHSSDTGLIGMAHELRRNSMKGGTSGSQEGSNDCFDLIGKDSTRVAHKRAEGGPASRPRRTQRARRTNSMDLVGAELGGDQDEYDGDSSLSLTPPSSGDELDGVVISGVMTTSKDNISSPSRTLVGPPVTIDPNDSEKLSVPIATKTERDNRRMARRLSNGAGHPSKFLSIKEETTGEFNENAANSDINIPGKAAALKGSENIPDSLRAAVVVELCLRAADVAHWYQSWDTMVHFNRRIFLELCKASNDQRGFDPRPNWFDNQAKIMETYLLPLAEQIEFVGVLRRGSGIDLVAALESNNDLWFVKGFDVVEALSNECNGGDDDK